ncbi:MAG: hypothetical protein KF862_15050 [Chitinophagaceae bacterium]|nr:hypothetical protein [Chitinophagaceae bacterium]
MVHSFHIPVLGLGFSVDTPVKVAPLGISSVASITDDVLLEEMRKLYSEKEGIPFVAIANNEPGFRSSRITAYLNMMHVLVVKRFESIRSENLSSGGQLCRYFELLPGSAPLKDLYKKWLGAEPGVNREELEQQLKSGMKMGAIDVNIMVKVDKLNLNKAGELINSDALEALKGFAESTLTSSVVLSAGMNPRLYSYIEQFPGFYPDAEGQVRKKIILKVSDFRSAFIQAKFLAKKGIWTSEFRIESGLNCGGHAFATDGYLLGPILEEFKAERNRLGNELFLIYQKALSEKGIYCEKVPAIAISVQGGIGTARENGFLLDYYGVDATGWGSPFLLVPEAVNIDYDTMVSLANAVKEDFYISNSSPLGVPFNNFRPSAAEKQRLERIAKRRPGNPCTKKFLVSNTEFTKEPICTASRKYQALKLKSLKNAGLSEEEYRQSANEVMEKLCLCEGLVTATYIKNGISTAKNTAAVAVCPGPNLAYFSRIFSLDEMVQHIYGQVDLLQHSNRSNMFINELHLYVEYLKKQLEANVQTLADKKAKYFAKFKSQLEQGIQYYKGLIPRIKNQTESYRQRMMNELKEIEIQLSGLKLEVSI